MALVINFVPLNVLYPTVNIVRQMIEVVTHASLCYKQPAHASVKSVPIYSNHHQFCQSRCRWSYISLASSVAMCNKKCWWSFKRLELSVQKICFHWGIHMHCISRDWLYVHVHVLAPRTPSTTIDFNGSSTLYKFRVGQEEKAMVRGIYMVKCMYPISWSHYTYCRPHF